MKKYLSLALWILVFEAVSYSIGMATQSGVDGWYASLTPPPMTPPNIVFPIMWSTLYALIAATGWTVWRHRKAQNYRNDSARKGLLPLYAVYMAMNWSWSFIFFGAQELLIGFIWIVVMDILALVFIAKAWGRLRVAAYLMIPPTLWTFYAAYLNGGYWLLN